MTTKTQTLATLSKITGYACAGIGTFHVVLGSAATVPGASDVNATTDSFERFLSVIFGAYGLAWLRAAGGDQVDLGEVRVLSATMALGGTSRLASLAHRGRPHWFQLVLTGVEFAVPAMFELLVRDVQSEAGGHSRTRSNGSPAPQ